jgi:hypothetical protein
VQDESWEAPLYWLKDNDGSQTVFTLAGVHKLDAMRPRRACEFL